MPKPSPANIRAIFGQNLQRLCAQGPSVSAICRKIGINRTQFNRYLTGDSFPRPDVLERICLHFNVDARILLRPLDQITPSPPNPLAHPALLPWLGDGLLAVPHSLLPDGFYRFSRQSFLEPAQYLRGLVHVQRTHGFTLLRGFEPRKALRQQGFSSHSRTREYRGIALHQEDGVSFLVARQDGRTSSFNFLTPVAAYDRPLLEGYSARTTRPPTQGQRLSRLVYEYIGGFGPAVLAAARSSGFCSLAILPAPHRRHLQPNTPLS